METTIGKTNYIVANENKLGYIIGTPSESGVGVRVMVIAVDVLAGGDPLLINRSTFALRKDTRLATSEDGERFCVSI